jgi:hypothetical protein
MRRPFVTAAWDFAWQYIGVANLRPVALLLITWWRKLLRPYDVKPPWHRCSLASQILRVSGIR